MIVSSWNVNSVRVRAVHIVDYLRNKKPNFLLLQEIKTENKNFPNDLFFKEGYQSYVYGQKSYNGVAILANDKIENIENNSINDPSLQSRVITGDISYNKKKTKLICIYVPNGNPVDTDKYVYKKKWLNIFEKYLKKIKKNYENIIVAGDFNIIPSNEDVYDPKSWENDALFKEEIREKFKDLMKLDFFDALRHFNKAPKTYTFWDYQYRSYQKNNGLRIDHFLVSNNLKNSLEDIIIDKYTRGLEQPSDHVPVRAVFI